MIFRLRHLLVFSISLLLLLSVFLVVLVGQHLQQESLEAHSQERTEQAVIQASRRLSQGVLERFLDLDVMVRRLVEHGRLRPDGIQELFDQMQNRYQGYAWLGLADRHGRVLAAGRGHLLGADVAARPWFVQGMRGPYLGDVHPALLLAEVLPKGPDGLPPRLVDIAVPVQTDGQVSSVLAVHLNWDWVVGLLGEFEQNTLRGVKREILLLTREGRVLHGPAGMQGEQLAGLPELAYEDGGPRYWSDGRWRSAATLIHGNEYYSPPGWVLVVRESRDDLLGLGESMRNRFWWAVVPILLAFLALVGLLGRYLARPIEAINAAARDGHVIPEVTGWAEVYELRNSLVQMTGRLLQQKDLVEAEVRARMAEFDHLLSALNNHTLVTMADSRGDITYCNDLFCEISGYAREEALGQNHRIVKSGVHPDAFYQEMWQTLKAGQIWSGLIANRHKDGHLYWVKSVIAPGSQDSGSPHAYVSVRTDVTELMEMQQALERLNRDLLRQSTLLTLLSRITATANEAFDRRDALYRCLQEICLFMNWRIGHAYEVVENEAGEARLRTLDVWSTADEEKYREFIVRSRELDYQPGQGLPGLVWLQQAPVFTWLSQWNEKSSRRYREAIAAGFNSGLAIPVFAGYQILGVIEFFSDGGSEVDDEFLETLRNVGQQLGFVFQRHDQAAQLNLAVSEANRANQAKSDFLSSMSHELRTPMNAIIGFAQMLELDGDLNADQRDNVGEILRAGRHLLHLINEVLDLARIESGKLELSLEPVAIAALIGECVQLTSTLADKRSIVLCCDVLPGGFVRGDALRLKQVLLNLLSNAIKYNRDAGSVHVSGEITAAGMFRVSVSDTGTGIPAGKISELFQPFQRLVGANSKVEGTGIGLTICKRLIEEMNGQVGVESVVGEGSTFWFEVPLASDQSIVPTDAPHDSLLVAEDGDVELAGQLYVLCVDDNPANLKFLERLLERRKGVRVALAGTPGEGIELAMAECPDLILLDINMPEMDGYEVLQILRANASTAKACIVAATANAMSSEVERGRRAGFDDYLTKPLDVQQVYALIDSLSERKLLSA